MTTVDVPARQAATVMHVRCPDRPWATSPLLTVRLALAVA
ncbi:UNVERIFIED_CONTAM: hypothetical protein RKD50_000058 [Streptomyces canus]